MRIRAILLLALGCASLAEANAAASAPVLPDRSALGPVPVHALRAEAVADAMAKVDRTARPFRFAVPVAVQRPLAAGLWDAPRSGTARWRLRIHSPGARSLSVHLTAVRLPQGAQLWVYGPHGEAINGPYTAAHVQPSGFWSPLVVGDQLVLELSVPAAAVDQARLEVAEAFHGYETFEKAGVPGSSGSCNIDAACQEQSWGPEIRSVAHITIGNQLLCSGQLLNNVQQDQRPLFITAWHCGIQHGGGTDDSVNFYFNYEADSCGGTASEPSNPVIGSTLLADDSIADFALLVMDDSPPPGAYFSGWDATETAGASSGASIHHPSGDAKKISLYDSPATKTPVSIGGECLVEAWEVQWSSGTTEVGSSGGGLWNASKRLVGVLSGGGADCNAPNGKDYYGRLERGWTAGASASGQLKAHLDPLGSCIAAIPGLESGQNAAPVTSGPERCESPPTVCMRGGSSLSGGGGGGTPGPLLLVMLAAALARRALRR